MSSKDNREFETKVLDFDCAEIIDRLRTLGAFEKPEYLARRYVFGYHNRFPEFIRLRDEGDRITLAYKKKDHTSSNLGNTIEIQTIVEDFDKTAEILQTLTFESVMYFETRHHIFNYQGVEYSIDIWPLMKPILEIEAGSEEKVQEGLKLLGLEEKAVGDLDMMHITKEYGFDVNDFSYFGFDKQEKFSVPPST